METFVVIQGSSFTSIDVHLRPFTSIDVAIDVDRHRHLRNFTSVYFTLRPFALAVSNPILVTFVMRGKRGWRGGFP